MIRGIYSAANAMDSAVQAHEIVAQNLAHANVPGFRARGMSFTLAGPQSAGGAKDDKNATSYIDFRPGTLQFTGAPLDIALDGDAFFSVQGPNGTLYTRNGAFHLDNSGKLVSQAGYPLLGAGGPLTIPSDAGSITVSRDGTIKAGDQTVGQIQLTKFANKQKLEPIGPTLFRANQDAGSSTAVATVLQGYRESSNVQPAEAMVAMISGTRHFESAQRALKAIAESIQMHTRPQG